MARNTLDSARIPRASKLLICGLFQKGRVLAQDAVILDLFSRRVVGWAMQPHLRAELALEALPWPWGAACRQVAWCIIQNRGTQYTAATYQAVLDEYGIVCSMSRKGDCWDNAVTESFFGTLKTELLHRRSWPTRRMAKDAVASYIEGFYNPYRLHSSLDYNSPMVFERIHDLKNCSCEIINPVTFPGQG